MALLPKGSQIAPGRGRVSQGCCIHIRVHRKDLRAHRNCEEAKGGDLPVCDGLPNWPKSPQQPFFSRKELFYQEDFQGLEYCDKRIKNSCTHCLALGVLVMTSPSSLNFFCLIRPSSVLQLCDNRVTLSINVTMYP